MAKFLYFNDTYDALTEHGLGKRYINADHIISIELRPSKGNRIKTLQSRLTLTNGSVIDVRESPSQIVNELISPNPNDKD
jgi:uncharacterized protein YlzI (FlbEa/FlbD family)